MGVPAEDWVAKASAPDAKPWERTLLKHYQLITLVKGDEASSTVLALQTSNKASYDDLDKDHKVWQGRQSAGASACPVQSICTVGKQSCKRH